MMLALLGAVIIGLCLGLLGSGGSILTIPILIFILDRPEKLAIAESLAIVGLIALVGSIPYYFSKQINWRSVVLFGFPGMIGAYIGGCCSYYISGSFQLTLFALLMLFIAGMMFYDSQQLVKWNSYPFSKWMTAFKGSGVGFLTGLIGVGGGVIIVPSLMILCNLSMPYAVGTSLFIIAMNSFTGFAEQWLILSHDHLSVDWSIIMIISFIGSLGCFVGNFLSKKISQIHLKKILGSSMFILGVYLLISQI